MSTAKLPDKPQRHWYRPHLSTFFVTAFVMLFFCLWNVAGYYRGRELAWDSTSSIQGRGMQVWAYGWPATYLEQGLPFDTRREDGLTWRLWERVISFVISNLILDAAVAGGASLLLGGLFECWRRHRPHLLQIYLWELGVVVALMCMALATGRHLILSATATETELREAELDGDVYFQSETPGFVHRWLPGKRCKAGDFVVEAIVRGNDSSIQFQMETIVRQRRIRRLHLFNNCPSDAWQKIANCRQLEEVIIGRNCLVESDLAVLARLPKLRKLDLTMGSLPGASLRQVGKLRTLEELTVNGKSGRHRSFEDWERDSQSLKGKDLQPLAALSLTKLTLAFNEMGTNDCELEAIGQMSHLRELYIHNRQLTHQDVTALRQLSGLEELRLIGCYFEDAEDQKLLPTR